MYNRIAIDPQRIVVHWDTGYENDKVPDIEAEADVLLLHVLYVLLHLLLLDPASKINTSDIVLR